MEAPSLQVSEASQSNDDILLLSLWCLDLRKKMAIFTLLMDIWSEVSFHTAGNFEFSSSSSKIPFLFQANKNSHHSPSVVQLNNKVMSGNISPVDVGFCWTHNDGSLDSCSQHGFSMKTAMLKTIPGNWWQSLRLATTSPTYVGIKVLEGLPHQQLHALLRVTS